MIFRRIASVVMDLDFIESYIPRDLSPNVFQLIIYRKYVQDPLTINFSTSVERDFVLEGLDKHFLTTTLT
jgi:hypothetical protein